MSVMQDIRMPGVAEMDRGYYPLHVSIYIVYGFIRDCGLEDRWEERCGHVG